MKKIFSIIAIISITLIVKAQTVKDIDGNIYKTVIIGKQTWMAENLRTSKYNNGNDILSTDTLTMNISKEDNPMYQWKYPTPSNNNPTQGRLYTWYSVTDFRNLCPTGWHVPSDTEWTVLSNFLGGDSVAGAKLKEAGKEHWYGENEYSTNESGFTALPEGYRYPIGNFYGFKRDASFWTSTEVNSTYAYYRSLTFKNKKIIKDSYNKALGFSVRCIMN